MSPEGLIKPDNRTKYLCQGIHGGLIPGPLTAKDVHVLNFK